MSDRVYARVPAQQETLTKSTPGSYLLQHTPVRDGSISFPQESVPSPGSVMKSVPHVGHNLSQIPVYPPVTGTIQTKLVVSASGDEYEQEAEHVSELVMRMPRPQSHQVHTDGEAYPNYQMERPGHGNGRLQMKRVQVSDSGQVVASPIVNEVLRSPSQPLDSATRAFMEPRFGHDFNHVRVHTDERAGTSSQMLNARAYTVGHNIVFSTGQYAPMTTTGQRLLAHELMHVIQQQATGPRLARTPGDREDTTIGTEWEPVEVAEWKGVLEKQGYEVFSRNEFSQVKWLREAFTDARASRPCWHQSHDQKNSCRRYYCWFLEYNETKTGGFAKIAS